MSKNVLENLLFLLTGTEISFDFFILTDSAL